MSPCHHRVRRAQVGISADVEACKGVEVQDLVPAELADCLCPDHFNEWYVDDSTVGPDAAQFPEKDLDGAVDALRLSWQICNTGPTGFDTGFRLSFMLMRDADMDPEC